MVHKCETDVNSQAASPSEDAKELMSLSAVMQDGVNNCYIYLMSVFGVIFCYMSEVMLLPVLTDDRASATLRGMRYTLELEQVLKHLPINLYYPHRRTSPSLQNTVTLNLGHDTKGG